MKYEPSIKELFDLIFDEEIEKDGKKEKKYKDLEQYKEVILKTIEETEELNARIYIQILDNIIEWIDKKQEAQNNILRCLILVNINFINSHIIFKFEGYKDEYVDWLLPINFSKLDLLPMGILLKLNEMISSMDYIKNKVEIIDELKFRAIHNIDKRVKNSNSEREIIELTNLYSEFIWIYWKMEAIYNYKENISSTILMKINNFIETGILIDE